MNIAEKTLQLKQDFDDVYEAGKTKERDDFWEVFQKHGERLEGYDRLRYNFAFSYNKFDDNTYNPKYPIEVITNGAALTNAFAGNTLITDTKVPIKVSTNNPNLDVYLNSTFTDCSNLITVELHLGDRAYVHDACFIGCNSLKNLNVTGTVIKSLNVKSCPLTTKSIVCVVEHLSDSENVTGQTVSFKQTAVNSMVFPYTSEYTDNTYNSWSELIATKQNWTFSLV